jgi:very-long-chain ceramide synthase
MFRYFSFSTLCDVTFTWFLLSWFLTRHVLFNIVIWSTYYDAPKFIPLIWDPERGLFFSKGPYIAFISSLVALQVSSLPFLL